MFCSKKQELSRCFEFLNKVKEYEIHVLPAKRPTEAQTIYDEFLSVDVSRIINYNNICLVCIHVHVCTPFTSS